MNYLGLLPGSGGGTSLTIVSTGGSGNATPTTTAAAAAERIDRGATWSDPEVDELLNIWTNGNVQAELKEATIKKHIFERIARSLRDKGFYRTAEQCREKIKRLKKEYRQAMNNNYRCVRGRATVKFFPRLQAVLDGSRPCPKSSSFYEATGGAGATTKVDEHGKVTVIATTTNATNYGLGLKAATATAAVQQLSPPHSYSECSAEEIKVEVNPAEVDNGSYNVDSPVDHHHHHHHLHHNVSEASNRSRSNYVLHRHSTSLPVSTVTSHALSLNIPAYNHLSRHLTIQRRIRSAGGGISISNGVSLAAAASGSSAGPVNLCTADDEHDDTMDDDEGSSGAGSITPTHDLTPTQNSPEPLYHHGGSGGNGGSVNRKRKFNRKSNSSGSAIGSQSFRDTLDMALDRFLKHQRESEERLFAWEERRIQMELEAEERFRQEDREMLRQIFTNLQVPSSSSSSAGTGTAGTNPEPSPSSSGGSHSNDR